MAKEDVMPDMHRSSLTADVKVSASHKVFMASNVNFCVPDFNYAISAILWH
jgi:hypothetical protein